MKTKIELTPKDCLYIDDSLSQLCTIKTRICSEKANVSDQEVSKFIEDVETVFKNQYDEIKSLLKEASK